MKNLFFKNVICALTILAAVPIFGQYTVSGTIRGGSDPLPGAVVSLTDVATSQQVGVATTDATGVYSISAGSGTYNMNVSPPVGSSFGDAVVNGLVVSDRDVTQNVVLIEEGIVLSGILKTPEGYPIDNATIVVRDQASNVQVGPALATDANGAYSIALTEGTYTIRAYGFNSGSSIQTPGYWSISRMVDNLTITSTTVLDLVVPFVTVTGKVTDHNGSAVEGARLTLVQSFYISPVSYYADNYSYNPGVYTDASGDYTLVGISHDYNTLVVLPPEDSGLAITPLTYTDLTNSQVLDINISPGVNLGGVLKTPDGTPIQNARMELYLGNNVHLGFYETTDATGAFNFPVAPNDYFIKARGWNNTSNTPVPGYWYVNPIFPNTTVTTDMSLDLTLPLTTMSGKVTDSNNTPVAGAIMRSIRSFGVDGVSYYMDNHYYSPFFITDANGDYSMPFLAYHSFDVGIDSPNPDLGDILVQGLDMSADLTQDFVLPQAVTLSGKVYDSHGQALPYVRLKIENEAGLQIGSEITTDATGSYSFSLVEGVYHIDAWAWGYQTGKTTPNYWSVRPLIQDFTLSQDTTMDIVIPETHMSGKTTDSNGVPVPGVRLASTISFYSNNAYYYMDNTSSHFFLSDEQGDYMMPFLAYNNHSQSITPPSGSGFATTNLYHLDLTEDILQNIILGFIDSQDPLILAGPYINNITDTGAVVEWQTNELATSDLYYGTSSSPTTPENVPGYRTNHSIALDGLNPDTRYYVRVSATDKAGNGPVSSSVISFRTAALPDTDPPLILDGPMVTAIGHNTATVQWTTSEPATGRVDYGTSENLGSNSAANSLVVAHEITLSNLTPDTIYHYKVASSDAMGNGPTESAIQTFRTLPTPDVRAPIIIAGPMVIDITDTEATVVWETDEPATSGVSYNDGTAYGVVNDDDLVTSHAVRLSGLTPDTLYFYTVSSTDGHGNGPTLSAENEFYTLPQPDTAAPQIIEGPIVLGITHQSAVIRWKTDEPSDSVIQYGLSPGDLAYTANRASLVTLHNLPLVGLLPGTTYYFRVMSTDGAGNGPAASDVYSFNTKKKQDRNPPIFTQLPTLIDTTDTTATIYWETDEPSDSVVDYGVGAPNLRRSNPEKTTRHQITLAGLLAGQTYALEVTSTDTSGNSATETSLSVSTKNGRLKAGGFTTDSMPDLSAPVITSAPQVISASDTTAMIRWETDEIADSRISYGVQGQPLSLFSGEIKHGIEHLILLTNLQPSTNYAFVASSSDVAGNGPTSASQLSFTTQAAEDVAPPSFSPQPDAGSLTDNSAVISWGTDEFATSQIDYGLDSNADAYRTGTSGVSDQHNLTLTNLEAGLTYYYRVTSSDSAGNVSVSSLNSFSTTGTRPLFSVDGQSVDEGDSGASDMTFTVTLNRVSSEDITVDYATVDLTATAGVDYAAASGTLTFEAGDTTQDITVSIYGDTESEDDETFALILSNAFNASLPDADAEGLILDDDLDCAAVSTDPQDASVCLGNQATFSAAATGSGPFSYQWRKDGVNISGAISSDYSIASVTAADAGDYDCVIENGCAPVATQTASLSIGQAPVQPGVISGTEEICAGAVETYSISPVAGADNYLWTVPNGAAITSGSGTNAITVTFAGSGGSVSVSASNACGASASSGLTVAIHDAVLITSHPANQSVCIDDAVTFEVAASGAVTGYQWRKDGMLISGANSASLMLTGVSASDVGSYDCVATYACGSVTSNGAALSLNDAVVVTSHPLGQVTCENDGVSFSVSATGDGVLSYQWRKDGADIAGATGSSFGIASATSSDAGDYVCVITGDCGSVASNAGSLVVRDPLSIATQPQDATQCLESSASFSVAVSGDGPFTYQWRKDGATIDGATQAVLSLNNLAEADAGSYDCIVTGCTSETTASATLTLNDRLSVSQEPVAQSACLGEDAAFSIAAVGTDVTYQWRKNGQDIPGANTEVFSLTGVQAQDAGDYDCVVSSSCGSETSAPAALDVKDPVAITQSPLGETRCPGESVSFAVSATGSGPLTYQWRKDGVDIPGATEASLLIPSPESTDAGSYDCIVTGCGSETSSSAVLTLHQPLVVTETPLDLFACPNEAVTLQVAATGSDLTYQWRKDGDDIPGATDASYGIPETNSPDTGVYDCVVSSACGAETTPAMYLEVGEPALVAQAPVDQTWCPEEEVVLTVTASGTGPFDFQWRKNGVDIPGAQEAVFVIPSMGPDDSASYTCVVSNDCGSDMAIPAQVSLGDMTSSFPLNGVAQGLDPVELSVDVSCASSGLAITWVNLNTGETYHNLTVVLLEMLTETTVFQMTAADSLTGEAITDFLTVLVPPNLDFQDLNGDGCNTIEDLQMVLPEWNEEMSGDGNGDGVMNLLDYLYINTSGSCNLR